MPSQPEPMNVVLRIDKWFIDMCADNELLIAPLPELEGITGKNLLTEKGLQAVTLLVSYMAGSIPDDTWQFQGLQAFMAVAFQKLEEQQKLQAKEGDTQHGR